MTQPRLLREAAGTPPEPPPPTLRPFRPHPDDEALLALRRMRSDLHLMAHNTAVSEGVQAVAWEVWSLLDEQVRCLEEGCEDDDGTQG